MAGHKAGDPLRGLPKHAAVTDVSARDGLQSVGGFVEPERRAEWIVGLLDAGVDEVEGASFVSPRALPQMDGAARVLAALPTSHSGRVWVLVPNLAGLDRALGAGARNVLCVLSATETHSRANLGRGIEAVLSELGEMRARISEAGARTRAALSVAFADPDEGVVATEAAAALCRRVFELGFGELTICDTYGAASPLQVAGLLAAIREFYPPNRVGLHLHDTFGYASANVLAGLMFGVARFDGSVLGLGGCPFLPGARGNVDTVNLVRFLEDLGVETGVDRKKLERAAFACESILKGRSAI